MQHPFHLMPDMMVGDFRIQARLGAGGFGAVFRVERDGEPFALKFAVHGPDSDDANRTDARARRELACLLLVHHPNVVKVWAHGRWPHPRTGFHYVVMDLVEGPTLTDWVKQTRPALREVIRVFATLALTLEALHTQAIHHRDLKGSNILVRARDGEPVLVDFGASEHVGSDSQLTEGPLPPGTPHLRTPEALRFHREKYADPTARYPFRPTDDLYALGATLYEVLTSVPPFPPTLPREVLTALIEKEMPASPAVLNPQVPPALGALVLRLLAKNPAERPASGQALHTQLEALLQALRHDDPAILEVPLSPGAHAATTEGTGGPAVMSGADDPERPLSGTEDSGGMNPSPGSTSPREEHTPNGPAERASPGSPWHLRRAWQAAVALLVMLSVLGAGLWRASGLGTGELDAGAPMRAAASSEQLCELLALLPPASQLEAPLLARSPRGLPDARPPAEAEEPSPSLPTKGLPMRRFFPDPFPTPLSPPLDKPWFWRLWEWRTLAGVAAACTVAVGCAGSDSALRQGPPPRQVCTPEARASMEEMLQNASSNRYGVRVLLEGALPDRRFPNEVPVTEGQHEVLIFEATNPGDGYPDGTRLVGEFFLRDMLYAHFTEAVLPDGRRLPFCGFLDSSNSAGPGVPFEPGSKSGPRKVDPLQVVYYYSEQPL